MDGVTTTNLSKSNFADELIGNWQGSTRRIPLERLVALLMAETGPAYATRAALYADLNWPDRAVARVYGDSNTAFNGVYRKSGTQGSGSWTRLGDLPTGSVETALIDTLTAEVRNGRVYAAPGGVSPAGQDIPDWVDTIIQQNNGGGRYLIWRRGGSPDPAVETETIVRDGNDGWWYYLIDSDVTDLRDEFRNGRVWAIHLATPSGLTPPEGTNRILCHAGGGVQDWNPVAAPANGAETDTLKKDALGNWWIRDFDSRVIGPAIAEVSRVSAESVAAESAARIAADQAEASTRADADGLLDPDPWPGDDAVHAIGDNGGALVTLNNGITRGTFTADDIFAGKTHTIFNVEEANQLLDLLTSGWPGDEGVVISVAKNGTAAMWDGKGRLRGTHVVEKPGWPGDWIMPLVVDSRGVVVEGYDIRDGSNYQIGIGLSGWPGDFIIALETDRTGRVARGYDIRDGSVYPAVMNGGGASVEFVDPGIAGDAWGAVADANGVVKFMSRMWQGEVIGFEKRGDEVLADTGSVATGIIAIGGGDIGQARSQRDYPWHVLDEARDYAGASNGADAAAAAYLDIEGAAYRARPTVISLAEVIGSTVEADVLPSAPRRVQLINRVRAASTALEAWDKQLVVDRIKLDLLDGAPTTAELTADNHYAAVGNGLRLEVAEATGQALLPVLMVNQGFGIRDDGTSKVILAEGRLDWNHFALGFVIPTPLYPFDLKPGTPATLTTQSALMVSEIEALALEAISAGGEWFCPSLEEATISGTTITARFATMSALILRDAANHGFTISGENSTAVSISNVSVSGAFVTITLDAVPDGTPALNYAFGQTGDPGDGKAANRGSLTDSWSVPSRAVPTETLYRYARSGRATIQSGA